MIGGSPTRSDVDRSQIWHQMHRLSSLRRFPIFWIIRHEPETLGHSAQGLHLHLQGSQPAGQQPQVQP